MSSSDSDDTSQAQILPSRQVSTKNPPIRSSSAPPSATTSVARDSGVPGSVLASRVVSPQPSGSGVQQLRPIVPVARDLNSRGALRQPVVGQVNGNLIII